MTRRTPSGRVSGATSASAERGRFGLLPGLVLTAALCTVPLPAQAPRPLVITGARVLDVVAGRYLDGATVVVERGLVTHVYRRAAAALPPDRDTLDLPGVTLVPGLGDVRASLAPSPDADADFHASLSLAYGVTMARNTDVRLPWAVAERDRTRRGEVVAPRLWTTGPVLAERASASLLARQVFDAEAARREVRAQAAAGVDWIAVAGHTGPAVYQAVIAAARAAKVRVSGEAFATSMAQLARLGIDAIEGLGCPARTREEYEQLAASRPGSSTAARPLVEAIWARLPEGDAGAAVAQMVRARTMLAPLLAGAPEDLRPEDVVEDPALALLPAPRRESLTAAVQHAASAAAREAAWRARARFVLAFAKAGGVVVTGSDYRGNGFGLPGAAIHTEMKLLVRAGLTPADAIRAATVNVARMLGAMKNTGQIRPGFVADFFGVQGDPLGQVEDLGRIRLVVRNGEVLDRQQLLAQAERARK